MNLFILVMISLVCFVAHDEGSVEERWSHDDASREIERYIAEKSAPAARRILRDWRNRRLADRVLLVEGLATRLSSKKATPVTERNDMTIVPRIKEFGTSGHGVMVDQDIFIEGGRAAWALEELIGVRLSPVVEAALDEERERAVAEAQRVVQAFRTGVDQAQLDRGS